MDSARGALPDDIEALRAALIAEKVRAAQAEAELAVARAKASDDQALIAHQQLQIKKLTRELYGPRSERTSRLLDQIGAVRGTGELSHRGRDRGREGSREDHERDGIHAQAPRTQAVSRAPAT